MPLGNREGGRARKRSQDISPDGMFPIKTLLFLKYRQSSLWAALILFFREERLNFCEIFP